MRKQWLAAFGSLQILGALLISTGCDDQNGEGGIYVAPSVYDFGERVDEDEIAAQFEVVNTTDEDARIVKIEPSCGCTGVQLSEHVIPAGGSIDLYINVDSEGRFGEQVFSVLLVTDNPLFPAIVAKLTGLLITNKVRGTIPYDIGQFVPGAEIDERVRVAVGTASSVKIKRVKPTDGLAIKATVRAVGDGTAECRFSGQAPLANGEFSATVDLAADDASNWHQQTILVRGNVKSRWRYPKETFLGYMRQGCRNTKSVVIEDTFAGSPVAIMNPVVGADVSETSDAVNVDVSLDNNGSVVAAVRYDAKSIGNVSEKICLVLHTSDGTSHDIELDLFGHVLE